MTCNNCGANLTDGSNFCNNCGTPIVTTQVTPINTPGVELAISGLVCGICSIFIFGLTLGVLGIIFSVIAKIQGYKKGMATAGIICGIIGIIIKIFVLISQEEPYINSLITFLI